MLLLIIAVGLAACTPAVVRTSPAPAEPYTFYLDSHSAGAPDNAFIPLDPQTLDDIPSGRPFASELHMISADGSTGLSTSYPTGRATRNPDNIWIHISDLPGGAERSRFHPPAVGLVTALSADGSRLLLQADADPHAESTYPPTVDWYVLDTAGGQVVTHIADEDNACFRQYALFDPSGERIYCVVDPALVGADEPLAMRIVAYDVPSGERAQELELPQVFLGGEQIQRGEEIVWALTEPGIAMTPDGRRIAVVHADADKITLLDAHSLTIEKSFTLQQLNPRDWFGFAPQTAHAKGAMEGTIRQAKFSADGRFLYIFSQEMWLEEEDAPQERGLWLVDLAQERLAAKALPDYQVQWLLPAPDGTIYAFGTNEARLFPYEIRPESPSTLWRLDGQTLEVLAAREFFGFRAGRLVVADLAATAAQKNKTTTEYGDCPVTRPPATPFIPPKPWPARPPDEGEFWYGDSDLWTALPDDGSWAQLALGEKFWWWSEHFDVNGEPVPDLTVTARRLDGQAAPFLTEETTNGHHESFHWAMLVGVELNTPGCWEFTGQYKEHELSFVLWVP